ASVAILVASLFFLDTVERVIEVVFFQAERQTLTIGFVEPRPGIVEAQIRELPGVLATEPVRAVAARLRHGQHVKRIALNGVPPHADLGRLLDVDTHPIEPPAGGIALARHIAEQLHVGLGDTVTVEVMQERRPVREVPVTRIVEEYMGFGSYMSIDSLNRLMFEGPNVSGMRVLADSRSLDALYGTLKDMPAVAGIALTNAALTGFRTTMENTMYVMIGFYIGFAALIALGVSYNSARVAFSERARSLASLRVLGFTNAEVTYILLGELGLQTLLALPLGCAMGYGLARAMSPMLNTDMYRFPLVIDRSTYGLAVLVVGLSAILCAAIIARKVYRLDLVAVLKARD
ncbi:MAG: ABC transporter permease, partial [Rhodospirillaceae bacterium]